MSNSTVGSKNNSVYTLAARVFVEVLLLFLISAPVFYLIISQDSGEGIPFLYIAARALRFILAAGLCLIVRKKSQEILAGGGPKRKRLFYIVLGCIALGLLLHGYGIAENLYYSVSYAIGIYPAGKIPLFLSVLWEQIFGGDFIWSALFGLAILFFPASRKLEAEAALK